MHIARPEPVVVAPRPTHVLDPLALALAGASVGLIATAGWTVRAGWAIARDPAAWHLLTGR